MADDGTMMRTPAADRAGRRQFGLTFVSIKALQDYRKKHEVPRGEQVADVFNAHANTATFRAKTFVNQLERRAPYRPR